MVKADYKAGFVLIGALMLVVGITINYFSAEITDKFLNIDIFVLKKKGIEPYSLLQTQVAEISIKIISVCADIGGILAIIYGFTSSKRKN